MPNEPQAPEDANAPFDSRIAPGATSTPEVEPEPREQPDVDVVQGDRVVTMRGTEGVAERDLNAGEVSPSPLSPGDSATEGSPPPHPEPPQPAPQPTPPPEDANR